MIEKQLQRKRDSLDKNLERLLNAEPNRDQRQWLPVEQFSELLQRERDRSDRRNLEFCVAMIELDKACRNDECFEGLLEILRNRLRLTDEFSRIDGTFVAIMLPDTSSDGAASLMASLKEMAADNQIRFRHHVYVYPFFDGDESLGGGMNGVGVNGTGVNGTDMNGTGMNGTGMNGTETGRGGGESDEVRPLFFTRRLPLWKRALDVVASSSALLILSPLFAATSLAVKLTSPGPVLFSQLREGHGGRQFRIYKFRTMRSDAEQLKDGLRHLSEQDGPAFKIKDDPRLTGIGKYLRRSCVDELPQLINVLRGEMTLVGPRPLPVSESQRCVSWQRRRLEVVPGLTCIWQVHGDDSTPFVEWMRMDLEYMRRLGLKSDSRLIMSTVMVVLRLKGSA